MNSIKKAQILFKATTLISFAIFIVVLYKVNVFNAEQKLIQYMPMGQYKIMTQKNISEIENISIEEYKVIINPDSIISDITAISEMIIETSKDIKKYNGSVLKFYGNPKDLKDDKLLAKVVYAPYGKLDEALKGVKLSYDKYDYSYEFIAEQFNEMEEPDK